MLCVLVVLVCDRSLVARVVSRKVGGSSGGLVIAKNSVPLAGTVCRELESW